MDRPLQKSGETTGETGRFRRGRDGDPGMVEGIPHRHEENQCEGKTLHLKNNTPEAEVIKSRPRYYICFYYRW